MAIIGFCDVMSRKWNPRRGFCSRKPNQATCFCQEQTLFMHTEENFFGHLGKKRRKKDRLIRGRRRYLQKQNRLSERVCLLRGHAHSLKSCSRFSFGFVRHDPQPGASLPCSTQSFQLHALCLLGSFLKMPLTFK